MWILVFHALKRNDVDLLLLGTNLFSSMTSLESWKEETWAWTHPPQIRWRTGCSGGRLALMPRAVVTSAPSGSPEDLLTTHYWPDPSCFCVSPSSQVILRLLVQGHHSWELLASNSKEKLLTRANNSLKKKICHEVYKLGQAPYLSPRLILDEIEVFFFLTYCWLVQT